MTKREENRGEPGSEGKMQNSSSEKMFKGWVAKLLEGKNQVATAGKQQNSWKFVMNGKYW